MHDEGDVGVASVSPVIQGVHVRQLLDLAVRRGSEDSEAATVAADDIPLVLQADVDATIDRASEAGGHDNAAILFRLFEKLRESGFLRARYFSRDANVLLDFLVTAANRAADRPLLQRGDHLRVEHIDG